MSDKRMRKYESGAAKRAKKPAADDAVNKTRRLTDQWFTADAGPSGSDSGVPIAAAADLGAQSQEQHEDVSVREIPGAGDEVVETPGGIGHHHDQRSYVTVATPGSDNTRAGAATPAFNPLPDDPSEWPANISHTQRCDIVERGPSQIMEMEFPANNAKRRFSAFHYDRVMANGEKVKRTWLVYSTAADKIFCFCCRLFGSGDIPLRCGMNAWEGLSKRLRDHEIGITHQNCLQSWMDLKRGIA
ncbi:MAG: hypothetical protein ACR2M9_03535 [Cyanophyceae cyanobacterium]